MLHTWGQARFHYPHLHCLVRGGYFHGWHAMISGRRKFFLFSCRRVCSVDCFSIYPQGFARPGTSMPTPLPTTTQRTSNKFGVVRCSHWRAVSAVTPQSTIKSPTSATGADHACRQWASGQRDQHHCTLSSAPAP
nr:MULTISPECIES: transposase [unclassified Bradyrhizobium]